MNKTIIALLLLCAPVVHAGEPEVALLHANVDLGDRASLQRGAKLFVNYCLSCHSAKFMRYNRMASDLGLTDAEVKKNMMFAADKVGSLMKVSMAAGDAKAWFGKAPPDLSVIARYRTPDWLYSYFLSFYADPDPARPFGVNNLVFKDVAMPHVLAGLQGIQVRKKDEERHGHARPSIHQLLKLQSPGTLNPAQYARAVGDLVNFLVYLGEPAKLVRYRLGVWVLLFLIVLFFLSRSLYKAYWKDIH